MTKKSESKAAKLKQLESLVFGTRSKGSDSEHDNESDAASDAEPLIDSKLNKAKTKTKKTKAPKSVWQDSDDETLKIQVAEKSLKLRNRKLRKSADETELDGKVYEDRLREQFEKIHGKRPRWADEDSESDADSDKTKKISSGKAKKLRKLELKARLKDTKRDAKAEEKDDQSDNGSEDSDKQDDSDTDDDNALESDNDDDGQSQLLRVARLPGTTQKIGTKLQKRSIRNKGSGAQGTLGPLPPTVLDISRQIPNINHSDQSACVIDVMDFHPKNPELFFTAGRDKTLRLFQIDGEKNPRIASYHFENTPIVEGCFSRDGDKIVLLGFNCSRTYVYEMESGEVKVVHPMRGQPHHHRLFNLTVCKTTGNYAACTENGTVVILDSKTLHLKRKMKMNSAARGCQFKSRNDNDSTTTSVTTTLITADREGYIYEWNYETGRCLARFRNDNCVEISSIAVSDNGSVLAVGTNTGNVDFFDLTRKIEKSKTSDKTESGESRSNSESDNHSIQQQQQKLYSYPFLKSLSHLQTTVTNMSFHPSSQLLSIVTKYDKDKLKLVNINNGTDGNSNFPVYSNFPQQKEPLRYVHSVKFSNSGGWMAVGNDKGNILLYRLGHFMNDLGEV